MNAPGILVTGTFHCSNCIIFSSLSAVSVCIQCDAGKFSALGGSTECETCALGKASGAGSSVCLACVPGQKLVGTDCIDCDRGRYSAIGAITCTKCANGRYQDAAAQPSCTACVAGKYGVGEEQTSDTCAPCGKGKYSSSQGAIAEFQCNTCSAGMYADQLAQTSVGVCIQCNAGEFSAEGGSTECSTCAQGKASDAGSSVCLACLPGQKLVGASCTNCNAGRYSGIGATVCAACENGRHQNQVAQASCIACAAGTYGIGAEQTSNTCKSCGKGKYSSALGATAETLCNVCAAGKYGTQIGQTSPAACASCVKGKFGDASAATSVATCKACKAGLEYQDLPGQPSCKSAACPVGTYGASADVSKQSLCLDCPAGTYNGATGLTSKSQCNFCPIGFYGLKKKLTSRNQCEACPAGKRGRVEGQSSEGAGCVACELGVSYQDKPRQASCKSAACPPGTFARSGVEPDTTTMAVCDACLPGTYNSASGKRMCDSCPAGRFSGLTGSKDFNDCTMCPGGTFGNTSGLTTPMCAGPCPPGKFSMDGLRQCLECGKGRFSAAGGDSECKGCPVYKTTLADGATKCVCEKLYYEKDGGNCTVCNPEDLNCDVEGVTIATMSIVSGAWRPNKQSEDIYDCPVPLACLGGNNSDHLCAEGSNGVLCATCAEGWFRSGSKTLCDRCPEDVSSSFLFAGLLGGGAILFILIFLCLDLRFGWTNKPGGGFLKPLVNATQQMTVLIMFPVKWPAAVSEMGKIFEGMSIDVRLILPVTRGSAQLHEYPAQLASQSVVFLFSNLGSLTFARANDRTACSGCANCSAYRPLLDTRPVRAYCGERSPTPQPPPSTH